MRLSTISFWTVSSSQSNPMVVTVRYGEVFATYIIWVPRVARKHGLVLAWEPFLTVTFLPFSVLAQSGGGGGGDSAGPRTPTTPPPPPRGLRPTVSWQRYEPKEPTGAKGAPAPNAPNGVM